MSDAIVLNGLIWDTENLSVNDKTHFTYEEAKAEAAKLGRRLPTKNEFEELLQLPHVFDEAKRGMWFAENQEDLKSDKSLFLPAAGYSFRRSEMSYVGTDCYYWSATSSGTTSAYGLNIDSANAYTILNGRNYGFTVRCVSDINKLEVMKTNQEIEFKIPEGYVIDNSKSTENKIVCKPIEPKYPKSWEDAFWTKSISGFDIRLCNIDIRSATGREKVLFKTKKQAASALAYAQLTQLMVLPCYNGDWKPNWGDPDQIKYCIERLKNDIVKLDFICCFNFLAFKSEKVRDAFFYNHIDLIKQFYEL